MKPIRNPFKDKSMRAMFEGCISCWRDKTSEFYVEGRQRRGAGHRCAFWDGFNGLTRSAHSIPGTLSWACYRAGQACAKEASNPAD